MQGLSVETDPQVVLMYRKFCVACVRSTMKGLLVETDPKVVLRYRKF
jgi:hypothetical protein